MLEIYFMITLLIIIILLYDLFRYSKDSYKDERNAIRRMRRKYISSLRLNTNNTYSSSGLVSTGPYNKEIIKHVKHNSSAHKSETLTRFFDVG